MDYLIRAEKYAEKRGDGNYFKEYYTRYREDHTVENSVWHTLTYLYDEDTAKLLKYQYWGPVL